MVSTRQMAITIGPSANDDGFQPTTQNRGGPSTPHHATNGVSNGTATAIPRRSVSPDMEVVVPPTLEPITLQDLPIEVLEKICGYVGYKKTAQMRMVSLYISFVSVHTACMIYCNFHRNI